MGLHADGRVVLRAGVGSPARRHHQKAPVRAGPVASFDPVTSCLPSRESAVLVVTPYLGGNGLNPVFGFGW